jgi:disulfide bond formation protein DsbB
VATSGLIAAYQIGEQWGIFPELSVCKVDHPYIIGSTVIPVVLCKDVGWSLFGLSLAAYNTLISLTVVALGIFLLAKDREPT